MSKKRIKKIEPVQAGKVTAIVSVALVLIVLVPFMLLFSIAGLGSLNLGGGMLFGGGLLMIVFVPIIYGIIGFIGGILYAVVYNFTYKYHGGLELEYDDIDEELNRIGS